MFGLRIFKYLLKIPTLILCVAFVVLNRQDTTLYYSPISDPLVLPLWLLGIVLFGVGFIVGAMLLWLNHWPTYREVRKLRKELKQTRGEVEELSDHLHREDDVMDDVLMIEKEQR